MRLIGCGSESIATIRSAAEPTAKDCVEDAEPSQWKTA
jgi:hypothetical protein